MTREDIVGIIKKIGIAKYDTRESVLDKVNDYKFDKYISVHGGVSKICLVFNKEDFVIKWSTNLREAEQELEIYEKAKAVGLDMFFPYTELFGENNGVTFILQEKIDYSVHDCDDKKEEKYQRISKTVKLKTCDKFIKSFYIPNISYNRIVDYTWAAMALSLYGKKVCKKLTDFIQENKINDLHNSNIGYKNDKPVFLDFSGYRN